MLKASFVSGSDAVVDGRKDAFIALALLCLQVVVSLGVAGFSVDAELISFFEDYLTRA